MAIEKRIGAPAPQPVETLLDDPQIFEAEVDGAEPEIEETEDGGAIVDLAPSGEGFAPPSQNEFYDNLAELVPEEDLDELGQTLISFVDEDRSTYKEWEDLYADGIKLLGLNFRDHEDEVFEGSTTVSHPALAEAVIKYQAKGRAQLLPASGIVRTQVVGKKTPEKEAQAQRVREFMNYQISQQMPEYDSEHDRMLFHQAYGGSAFTKTYYDDYLKRPVSRFIKPQNFVIDYYATDLATAHRYTEIISISQNDLRRQQLTGFYRQVEDLRPDAETSETEDRIQQETDRIAGREKAFNLGDARHTLYEVHTFWAPAEEVDDRTPEEQDLELELPYIITIDRDSRKVLGIRRNWREPDPKREKRLWFTHWPFIPGFGFYGYGYLHIIGGLAKTATSTLRQLQDAGTFANFPGGFKARGLRVIGSNAPLSPGEWRDVNAPGIDISKALLQLPYKEPSATLFNLLQFTVGAAQRFADSADQVVSEATNYGPVGTTLALLEAGGKLFTAIHERLFKAQGQELKILAEINAEFLPPVYPYDVVGGEATIKQQDFDDRVDVLPVTDPRSPTAAHRLANIQATLSIAQQFPKEHNLPAVIRDFHAILGADDPDKYMRKPQDAKSFDPVSENAALLNGIPVKATEPQNHEAHIQVHMLIPLDPQFAQNPTVVQATMAHIQAHLAQKFRLEVQQRIGQQLPPLGEQLPPEVENEIALKAAAAVQEMLKEQGLTDEADDPIIALQQAEIALKEAELALQADEANMEDRRKRDLAALDRQTALDRIAASLKEVRIQTTTQERIARHKTSTS